MDQTANLDLTVAVEEKSGDHISCKGPKNWLDRQTKGSLTDKTTLITSLGFANREKSYLLLSK